MDSKDKTIFGEIISQIAIGLSGESLSADRIEIYFNVLKKYSIEEFKTMATNLIKNWKFSYFPNPAHFIEALEGKPEDLEHQALEAWNDLVYTINNCGSYGSPIFDDGATARAVQSMGGWIQICQELTFENTKWKRQEFMTLYKSYKHRKEDSPMVLYGRTDTRNMSKYSYEELKRFGMAPPRIEDYLERKNKQAEKKEITSGQLH